MECNCSPYDPEMFGVSLSVTRHRGQKRVVNTEDKADVMLRASWKYFVSRGWENPFDRGKKEIPSLIAEPELRSQLHVEPPVIKEAGLVILPAKDKGGIQPKKPRYKGER